MRLNLRRNFGIPVSQENDGLRVDLATKRMALSLITTLRYEFLSRLSIHYDNRNGGKG